MFRRFKGKGKSKGRGNARTRKRARAKAKDSRENVTIAQKQVIPHESARKAKWEETQKEKEAVSNGKAQEHGAGEGGFGKSVEKNLEECRWEGDGGIHRPSWLRVDQTSGRQRRQRVVAAKGGEVYKNAMKINF